MVGNAIITVVSVRVGAGGAYIYGRQKIEAQGPLQEDKVVNIPARAEMTDIADILQREGVIDNNRWAFIGSVLALKARSELKPGEYLFQKNASLRDVIGTIVEGKVVQHAVTIPEGLTSEQIMARLSENDIFSGSVREVPREGTLLPETYKFPRGTPRDQVIARMQQAQKRVLSEIWERRNPDIPIKTPEQLVTLASIVEKETGKADERSRVAAVFVNRLRQKIKLQSDPTIIYGLVGGKGTLGRPIKRSEIQQPSPYNTYVVDGLPPGPIAIRDGLLWRRPPIPRERAICSLSPTVPVAMPSATLTTSTRKTLPNFGRWKSKFRTTRPSRRRTRAGRGACAGRRQPDGQHGEAGPGEEAGTECHSGQAGRGSIDHVAAGGSAIGCTAGTKFHFCLIHAKLAQFLACQSQARTFFRRISNDGTVEHDRLCPKPWRQRTVRVRMGVEVGQCQGLRPSHAAAAGMGRTRGLRQKARW